MSSLFSDNLNAVKQFYQPRYRCRYKCRQRQIYRIYVCV